MNLGDIVVQQAKGRPEQLLLLHHGMGGHPENMTPLGRRLASAFPRSTVICVCAPRTSALGGYEWFSVAGITDANRIERVAQAMPDFLAEVRSYQQAFDVTPAVTALVGFSQGAVMSLEASFTASPPAGRIVAISGRFAKLPDHAPSHTTIHLLHGKEDRVIPYRLAVEAALRLRELGADFTADIVPFAGHAIHDEIVELAVERLSAHVPKRLWDEAVRAAGKLPGTQ
jgi:phospholipase/carboxylesterase